MALEKGIIKLWMNVWLCGRRVTGGEGNVRGWGGGGGGG